MIVSFVESLDQLYFKIMEDHQMGFCFIYDKLASYPDPHAGSLV